MVKQATSDDNDNHLDTTDKYQYTVLLGPRFNTSVRQNEQNVVLDRFYRCGLLGPAWRSTSELGFIDGVGRPKFDFHTGCDIATPTPTISMRFVVFVGRHNNADQP